MRAIASRSLSLSKRCYRRLLRVYPHAFLTEFEDLLCQAFGDLAHRAVRTKGFWGLFVLWLRTVPDLISSVLSQRFSTQSEWRFRLRWIAACSAGGVLTAACIFGPAFIYHEILIWFGKLPRNPPQLIPITSRSVLELLINVRILRDTALLGLLMGVFQSLALGWKRFRRAAWVIATTLGVMLTVNMLMMIRFIPNYLRLTIHPWRLMLDHHPGLYYGGGAAFSALILGMLQTLVLARRNPRALVWIPASAIGVFACSSIMWIRADRLFRSFHTPFTFYSMFGLIVGLVYGLVTVLPLEWILQTRESQVVSGKSLS